MNFLIYYNIQYIIIFIINMGSLSGLVPLEWTLNNSIPIKDLINNQITYGFNALNDIFGRNIFNENNDIVNVSYNESFFSFNKNNVSIEIEGNVNNITIKFNILHNQHH